MKIIGTIIISGILAVGSTLMQSQATAQLAKPVSIVSLTEFKRQLQQLQGDVSATVSALNKVKASGKNQTELAKAADELATCFNGLETRVETVRTNATAAKARINANFEAWAKELTAMQNPNLREKAQDRLTRSQKEFEKIVAEAGQAKEDVLPFVSEVKDIVIYLGADLSEDAVKSLSHTIWKLSNRSKSVNGSIGDVIEQINDTIQSLPQK